MVVACRRIYERRIVCDVAKAICRIGNGAAIVYRIVGIEGSAVIVRVGRGRVEIHDAIVQCAIGTTVESAAVICGRISDDGAIVQRPARCTASTVSLRRSISFSSSFVSEPRLLTAMRNPCRRMKAETDAIARNTTMP